MIAPALAWDHFWVDFCTRSWASPLRAALSALYPLKDGTKKSEKRWVAEYRWPDASGKIKKYKNSTATTKRQGRKNLEELKARAHRLQTAGPIDLEPKTVGEYLDGWHEGRIQNKKIGEATARNEERHVRVLKDLIGTKQLRPDDVEVMPVTGKCASSEPYLSE